MRSHRAITKELLARDPRHRELAMFSGERTKSKQSAAMALRGIDS
jgi:hypothetical protein